MVDSLCGQVISAPGIPAELNVCESPLSATAVKDIAAASPQLL
jgi:hypothetical protein